MELKKIWATGLAGAAIAASLAVPTVAQATTVEQTVVEGLSLSTPLSELPQTPNNDELFNEYVRRLFYGDFDISLLGTSGYDQLSVDEREIYDLLEDAIEQIASGTRERTDKIALPEESYVLADLGSFDLTTEEGKDEVSSAVFAKWNATYDYATAYYALLDDHPYEFYWFDKTGRHGTTGAFRLSYSWQTSGGTITISPTISFLVAENYCANTSDPYIVDTTDIQRAQSAAANAQEIIGKHASESDYQKLVSYRDEICNLVSYNDEAAADDNATNMDPWALVYVFDKDASTEVVCEGYSKAFQYLCDLSDFNSSLVRCTTVSGEMSSIDEGSDGGQVAGGGHMWNVVKMDDGRNYLVDVTNSDSGMIGQNGGLFLASYANTATATGDPEGKPRGYTFGPVGYAGKTMLYTYGSRTYDLYPADILNISSDPYTEPEVVEKSLENATVTVDGTYTYNGSAQTPGAENVTVTLDGTTVPQDAYTIEAANNADAGEATLTVTAVDGQGYTDSANGTFTIAPKALTASIAGSTTKTYDGDTTVDDGLSIALDGAVENDDVTATATFAYEDANAGEQKTVKASDVKLTGSDASNYSLNAPELTAKVGTITKATPSGNVTCDAAKLWAGASTSEVKLTWTGTPEGTVALAAGTLEAGTRNYSWTFTPTDTTNYEKLTGTISLTATEDTVTAIEVTTPPTKTQYVYGEKFDPAGMVVTATYASGATADVTGDVAFGPDLAVGQTSVTISYGDATASVNIAVSPKPVTPAITLAGADGLVYTGAAQTPSVTVRDGDAVVPAGEYEVSYEGNVNAGTATVKVTDAEGGNYDVAEASATFEIAMATPTLVVTATPGETFKDGATISVALGGVNGEKPSGTVEVEVNSEKHEVAVSDGSGTLKLDDLSAADTYEVTASFAGAGNYGPATATTSFSLDKATPDVTVTYVGGTLYAGTPVPSADKFTVDSDGVAGTLTLAEATLAEGTASYAWTFTPEDTGNYNVVNGSVELTAEKDVVTAIEVTTPPTKTQYVYGEKFDPAGMVVTATYASGATADVTSGVAFGPDLAVGQTSVSLSYEGLTAAVDIAVSPKAITPTLELAGADGLVYTGAAQTPSVTVRDGDAVVPAGEYEVSYEGNVNAGTATVRIADAEGGNYDVAEASATFEIAKATPTLTVTAKTAEGSRDATLAATLDGVNGEKISGVVELAVDGESYTVTVENGSGTLELSDLAAGVQHTVKTTYAGSQNYEESEAFTSFSVDKATPIVSVAYEGGTVYPSTPLDAIKAALEVTTDVPGEIELADATLSVGVQTLTWTFTPGDTANYNTVSGTVTVNVVADTLQSIAVTTPPTKTEYVAGDLFDPTGMVVTATYASGATEDVTDYVTYPSRLTAGQDSVELSYEKDGVAVTCTVSVNVLAATGEPTLELRHDVTATYDGAALEPSDLLASALYGDEAAADSDLTFSYMRTGDDGSPVGVSTQGLPCDAGTYYVTAELAPKIVGDVAYGYAFTGVSVTIDPAELTSDLFEAIPDQTYDGAPVEPAVTIADPDSGFLTVDDFTVTYEGNAAAGTGYAVVTAAEDGNFTGSVKLPFTITAAAPGPTPGGGSSAPSEPTYAPEVPETDRGEVSVTPARPHEGDTVTITPEPDEGNEVRSVTVTDEDGNVIEVTMGEDGTWSFEQPEGEVTIEVVFGCDGGDLCTSHAFPDVDHDKWYHDAIDWAVDAGAFHGYDSGSFGPDDTLTREQAAAVLWNLFGGGDASAPGASMPDVAQGQWYSAAVNWAVANGVMNGYDGTGTFGVGDALTREQFTGMVANACGADLTSVDLSVLEAYGDFEGVSEWAKRAMAWAIEAGVINGVDLPDGTRELQAGRNISRAEMAAMMKNAIDAGVLEMG